MSAVADAVFGGASKKATRGEFEIPEVEEVCVGRLYEVSLLGMDVLDV